MNVCKEGEMMSESTITKNAIAAALKELCHKKSFDKITVGDIASLSGLNRQTFYYHFQDKYELLDWIYYGEGFKVVVDGISFENWHDHLMKLLQIMKQEQVFYTNTIKADESYFKDYLFKMTCTIFKEALEALDDQQTIQEEDKDFFAQFYSYGICGVVIHWVLSGMKSSPKAIADNVKKLAQDSEKMAMIAYDQTNG